MREKYTELDSYGYNADVELLRTLVWKAFDAGDKARVALARHVSQHHCEILPG
jgi:hypothetical protein